MQIHTYEKQICISLHVYLHGYKNTHLQKYLSLHV